jgi:cell wall assembly regulator SMI1
MKSDTLNALERMFHESPVMCAGAVNRTEVGALENQIGFRLPADYREFVERFGGAIVGPFSVYGLKASEAMGDEESSAVKVTKRFRADAWGTDKWLVVSMDHSGNPVGLDPDGKIWISDHDARTVEILASSFEEYLRKWCLKLDPL